MDYFTKVETPPTQDLSWNIPELKRGIVNVIGGNIQNFRTIIKISEFLTTNYPIESVRTILPDALKPKLPSLPNLSFLASTDSGSFADEAGLRTAIDSADFSLIIGDLSKNNLTGQAITSACQNSARPLLITRDSVDLIVNHSPSSLLMNQNIVFLASMPSLQKLLRSVYYPKMLLLSQSLIPVADVLHKFTLSYPTTVITLHSNQILIAKNGEVKAVPLAKSGYLPMTFWGGEFAAKVVALNLYNPDNAMDAIIAAIFQQI